MKLQKLQILDGSWLKLLAVVTMFIDHATLILLPCFPILRTPLFAGYTIYKVLRKVGRLAFPLFCFLLALPLLSGGFAAWAAFIPVGLYNGKRGFIRGKVLKYAFYCFYPVHILLLLGIRYILL